MQAKVRVILGEDFSSTGHRVGVKETCVRSFLSSLNKVLI